MPKARFRRGYATDASDTTDPTLEDRVFELLETWFTGISERRKECARLGGSWTHCSIPFVHEEDGRLVSHVGLLEMPFVIDGERKTYGGIHGVCTLESARRQGHFGRIMDELLEYCEGRYETLELGTENPEYYEPFGFRIVPEHRFRADIVPVRSTAGFRPFDHARPDDLESLDRLLTDRIPVSERIGVVGESEIFKFSQGTDGLHYSEALDCYAAFEIEGSTLSLFDVVATEMPSLDALLSEIDAPIDSIDFYFTPDRFDVATTPEVFRYDDDYYMVRGPFPLEGERFMVPPPARH